MKSLTCGGGGTKAPINFTKLRIATSAIHGLTRTWCIRRMATRSSDLEEFEAEFEHIQGLALRNFKAEVGFRAKI